MAPLLLGLEQLSREVDMPFRESWHALPIDGVCSTIRANCLETQARRHAARAAAAASSAACL